MQIIPQLKKKKASQTLFLCWLQQNFELSYQTSEILLCYVKSSSTMATVTIKIDNKIKMDRGHMNLRTAHQEQFISSRRKIERGEGVFHSASTEKNSP